MEATDSPKETIEELISRILGEIFQDKGTSTNDFGFSETDSPESINNTNKLLGLALTRIAVETREKFAKLVKESNKQTEDLKNDIHKLKSFIDELEEARTRTFKISKSWAMDE